MLASKMCLLKLFFNRTDQTYYIQIGEELLMKIKDVIALNIHEKEQMEIRHVNSIKEMQLIDKTNE